MTLKQYLEKRHRYEIAVFVTMTTLFGLVNATSKILERVREGYAADWAPALVSELTGTWAVLLLVPAPAFRHQFLVNMLDRSYLVKSEQIDWVQSAGNYVLLHCADRSYPMRMTLSGMVSQLDPKLFLRVHRTAIVNVSRIVAVKESGDIQLELENGTLVPVSKTYLPVLKQHLNGHSAATRP
ncbi:LytTR family DNA-binding domain-containing protein [Pseudohongiella spirulinae]|uniref:HTH LytTR-type domain-containing protein n=1 Tax=Pseudohongiella spirulinae TaxID=1249552 RepID=A0A0S2KBU2_9GAMM|nr:LytTR family DNA-binding domain-containing protein [Pseudohongiella spirulinae]ALO45788.1 hypothetical protein PS2015_1126 [Pseudohongiella spirulinae]